MRLWPGILALFAFRSYPERCLFRQPESESHVDRDLPDTRVAAYYPVYQYNCSSPSSLPSLVNFVRLYTAWKVTYGDFKPYLPG